MENYNEMPYYTLKSECKRQGLDTKGSKEELIKRLNGEEKASLPEEPEKPVEAALPESPPEQPATPYAEQEAPITAPVPATVAAPLPSQPDITEFLPDRTFTPVIDTSRYAPWLTDRRLEKLAAHLDRIAAGKGRWNYQIDHKKGAYQVEFDGRINRNQSTTLIDTDAKIIQVATHYFNARLYMGKNAGQSLI